MICQIDKHTLISLENGNGKLVYLGQPALVLELVLSGTLLWHEVIGDPTLADAILDRLLHNAHKLISKGESMRKKKAKVGKA